jgi:hypothetical protein
MVNKGLTVDEEASEKIHDNNALKNLLCGNVEAMMRIFQETLEKGFGFEAKMDNLLDIFSDICEYSDQDLEDCCDYKARSARILAHRVSVSCLVDPLDADIDEDEIEETRMEKWYSRIYQFLVEAGFEDVVQQFDAKCEEIDAEEDVMEEECDCGEDDCDVCNASASEQEEDDDDEEDEEDEDSCDD